MNIPDTLTLDEIRLMPAGSFQRYWFLDEIVLLRPIDPNCWLLFSFLRRDTGERRWMALIGTRHMIYVFGWDKAIALSHPHTKAGAKLQWYFCYATHEIGLNEIVERLLEEIA
jgi:hypothetical protein